MKDMVEVKEESERGREGKRYHIGLEARGKISN
jgi:hypothetical protein